MGDGCDQPIGAVLSIYEGCEIAGSDMRRRMKDLDRGGTSACPECYRVWAQGLDGEYIVAKTLMT
jgi:hypothetical protein